MKLKEFRDKYLPFFTRTDVYLVCGLSLLSPPIFYALLLGPAFIGFIFKHIYIKLCISLLGMEFFTQILYVVTGEEMQYSATTDFALKGFILNFVFYFALVLSIKWIFLKLKHSKTEE